MFDERFPLLTPISFFALEADIHPLHTTNVPCRILEKERDAFLLPSTASLTNEESFATVAIAWHPEGIALHIDVDKPIERVSYPDLKYTDSVELFIDTRNRKTAGFANRFCHHFFFLAEPYLEHFFGEITRFRTDDAHPLCQPEDLFCHIHKRKKSYGMDIFLPKECLIGYSPDDFSKIGFNYRIHRPDGKTQHFAARTDEYAVESHPSLWGSLNMLK